VLLIVSKGNLADVIAHGLPVTTGDALALNNHDIVRG
jgi:hypothetical protein